VEVVALELFVEMMTALDMHKIVMFGGLIVLRLGDESSQVTPALTTGFLPTDQHHLIDCIDGWWCWELLRVG